MRRKGFSHVLVTGSSGFIGSHLLRSGLLDAPLDRAFGLDLRNPTESTVFHHFSGDVRSTADLRAAAPPDAAVVHLAAQADVVIPLEQLEPVLTTNIDGTLAVLQAVQPKRMVFASSCAVYGNTPAAGASATRKKSPLGLYGMSKATGEMICAEWARATGNTAVVLRLGNVVGPRCRGLIPYLVRHALRHPQGNPPAELRGNGNIIRDYVPVTTVVQAIRSALSLRMSPGRCRTFNVGTGRAMSNRQVAEMVQRFLARQGLGLSLNFDTPVAPGEALQAVLDPRTTCRHLALEIPSPEQVEQSIEDAVLSYLADAGAARQAAILTAGERS